MKHKVLLVGLGQVGMGYDFDSTDAQAIATHAKAFASHPDFELVGGVDTDPAACARFAGRFGGWVGSDLVRGLDATQPDVMVIASPTQHHAQAVRVALGHTRLRLILCEKPLAYTLEEAEEIVAHCSASGCLLYVNYLRRVEPGALEVKQRLQDGRIESPVKGVVWYSKGLLHSGSHFSNLLEFWLGPIASVKLVDPGRQWGREDFEPDFRVRFANGEVTFLAAKEEHFSHHEIQLVAPNGCLRYEQGGARIRWQAAIRDPDAPAHMVPSAGEMLPSESERLQFLVAEHARLCLDGKPSSLCPGADALETLKWLLETKVTR